ncbi:MAG TPA: hypothetical protein PKK43_09795, partial [Spirochaetota bacterium]|nr:hypothetical protein [Spirochaetota bacterium]
METISRNQWKLGAEYAIFVVSFLFCYELYILSGLIQAFYKKAIQTPPLYVLTIRPMLCLYVLSVVLFLSSGSHI